MPDQHARRGPAEAVLGTVVAAARWAVDTASPPAADASGDAPRVEGAYVVLGAAGAIEDRLRDLFRTAGRATNAVGPMAVRFVPPFVRHVVDDAVHRLDARGRATAAASATSSAQVASTVAGTVIQEELVVNAMLQIVDEILPIVLDRLNEEPEQIRTLVERQSLSMAGELTNAARSKAAEGDELVDRIVNRVRHWRTARTNAAIAEPSGAEPVTPPPPLPAGP